MIDVQGGSTTGSWEGRYWGGRVRARGEIIEEKEEGDNERGEGEIERRRRGWRHLVGRGRGRLLGRLDRR